MPTLRVQRRALTLATRGILSGVALTIATHGLLQIPQPDIEIPVVTVPRAGGGGGQYVHYLAVPQHYKYVSKFRLLIDPESLSWLSKQQPLTIEKLEPTKLRAVFNSEGVLLRILSESEWKHWDEQEHEEELLILMALKWFSDDDDDGGFYL